MDPGYIPIKNVMAVHVFKDSSEVGCIVRQMFAVSHKQDDANILENYALQSNDSTCLSVLECYMASNKPDVGETTSVIRT